MVPPRHTGDKGKMIIEIISLVIETCQLAVSLAFFALIAGAVFNR